MLPTGYTDPVWWGRFSNTPWTYNGNMSNDNIIYIEAHAIFTYVGTGGGPTQYDYTVYCVNNSTGTIIGTESYSSTSTSITVSAPDVSGYSFLGIVSDIYGQRNSSSLTLSSSQTSGYAYYQKSGSSKYIYYRYCYDQYGNLIYND
jgi:hypothetical protein